jgi:type VI secretion system protein ImpK
MSGRTRNLPLFGAAVPDSVAGREPTVPMNQAAAQEPARAGRAVSATGALPQAPSGYGRIVRAAWPLLSVLSRLRTGAVAIDADGLKLACVRSIKRFEEDASIAGVGPSPIRDARYALCTAVDEAVLASEWGDRSDWAQDSLLATFHQETWGGEKVFAIVDRLIADPARDPELAEMVYLLLSFGFQGMYHLRRNGSMEIEDLRERLYTGLRRRAGEMPPLPSPLLRAARRRSLSHVVPVWVVALACLMVAVAAFLFFREGLVSYDDELVPTFKSVVPSGV